MPGRDRDPVQRDVLASVAALVLGRRVVAEDLLDGLRDAARVVEDHLPLLGVSVEEHDRVGDELRDGLGAGSTDQRAEAGDLAVVELLHDAVVVGHLDLGEAAEHVVGRVGPLLGRQPVEVGRHGGAVGLGGLARPDLTDLPGSIESSQWRICWRSGAGTPSILEMISTGNGPAKPPTSSNLVRGVELVQVARDDLADHRLERADGPRREHPAHERPQSVVPRRVDHDQALEVGAPAARERGQIDAVLAAERTPVLMRFDHVVPARQRGEPVLSFR